VSRRDYSTSSERESSRGQQLLFEARRALAIGQKKAGRRLHRHPRGCGGTMEGRLGGSFPL
jgi:hypothetical protein